MEDDPNILGQPETKKKRGRPPKPVEKDFNSLSEPEQVLMTYFEGNGDNAVCRALQISRKEFDERVKNEPAFARLIDYGRTLAQAWWEDRYKDAAMGVKIPAAAMVNLYMKNVFAWAEKSETDNRDVLGIEGLTRDEALKKLRELGPNIISLIETRELRDMKKPINSKDAAQQRDDKKAIS